MQNRKSRRRSVTPLRTNRGGISNGSSSVDWRAVLPPIIAGVPRRTEVPGTSFSALSSRNLAPRYRASDRLSKPLPCQAEFLDSPMAASFIRSVNVGQNDPDTKESTRISVSGGKGTHYFRNSNENKGISFCSYLAFLSESL